MKRALIFLLSVVMLWHVSAFFCCAETNFGVSAESAVLIDADSGRVLWEKNAHSKMGMASTTKIMTALTVLRLCSPEDTVVVSDSAIGTEGSSIYLCKGEKMTVEQLLYGLLLASANDAAVALAIHCSGSVENFADQMNVVADELGLENTNFTNPHGLYDEEHYTTSYELALITREAMKVPLLSKIFATYKASIPFCGEADKRLLVNHNKMLKSYDGAVGVKTGFTKKTGRCLVSGAKRDGLTLICVTLNAPDDWRDHTAMLDYGYENYCRVTFADVGEYSYSLPVVGGEGDTLTLTNSQPLVMTLPQNHGVTKCTVNSNRRFAYAPTVTDKEYAHLTVNCDGQTVESPLVATEIVKRNYKKNLFQKITDFLKKDR